VFIAVQHQVPLPIDFCTYTAGLEAPFLPRRLINNAGAILNSNKLVELPIIRASLKMDRRGVAPVYGS
jgi:hypothetical protein